MSEKEVERERKEKIEKLKEEKRQMEEELDDLKGNTKKGKAICALVGILVVLLLLGGITVLIKTDAGGFATSSLAPLIGDVPVARSILPKYLQRKTAKELAAEQAAQQAASQQNDTQMIEGGSSLEKIRGKQMIELTKEGKIDVFVPELIQMVLEMIEVHDLEHFTVCFLDGTKKEILV